MSAETNTSNFRSLKKLLTPVIFIFSFVGSAAAQGACRDSGLRIIAEDPMGDSVLSMPGKALGSVHETAK